MPAAGAGLLPPLREVCDRHGGLAHRDEVMCGMGRTGTLHAVEGGHRSDLMAIAKGLGGGYQPIGGVLVHERMSMRWTRAAGSSSTATPTSGIPRLRSRIGRGEGAAARTAWSMRQRCSARVWRRSCTRASTPIARRRHPRARTVMAIELVENKASKRPFDPALRLHGGFLSEALALGLMVYPMGGTVDGKSGDPC